MSTLTVFSTPEDGRLRSSDATYATARAGGGTINARTVSTTENAGQNLNGSTYECFEIMVGFDTSSLGAGAVISAAELSFVPSGNPNDTARTFEVRLHDWAGTLTSADWVAGADLGSKTLLASVAASALTATVRATFTESGSNLRDNINKTGVTYMLLCTDDLRTGAAPTANHLTTFYMGDESGTVNDPQLVITYTTGAVHTGSQATETETPNAGTVTMTVAGSRATETDTPNAGSVTATFGTYIFTPPVVYAQRRTLATPHPGNALMKWYGPGPIGQTVIRTGATYTTKLYPTQAELDAADEYWLGGHDHVIDDVTAGMLIAAGFGAHLVGV